MHPQPGIFALGTTDHCYLEFDLSGGDDATLASAAALPATIEATSGVNVVVGVRPSVWASAAPDADVPSAVSDWDEPITGPDGFRMPATQHDLWVWLAGGDHSVVFDAAREGCRRSGPAPCWRLR